jgi:hypothetical protein
MEPTTSQPDPSRDAGAGNAPPASVDRGYEPMLVRGRGLAWFVAWFLAMAAVIHVALWVLLKRYDHEARQADRPANVIVDAGSVPRGEQGPPLQPSTGHDVLPREDLAAMRQAEDETFARLGWVDPATHTVRVPDAIVVSVARRVGAAATQPVTRPMTAPTTPQRREEK